MRGRNANSINGKPVVFATKKLKLHISADDAKKGANKDPGGCAAARALKRLKDVVAARVHIRRTYVLGKDDKWRRYITPDPLRNEIISFDRGGGFTPGDYELRPLSPSAMAVKHHGAASKDPDRGNYLSSQQNKTPRKLIITRSRPHRVTGVRHFGANR